MGSYLGNMGCTLSQTVQTQTSADIDEGTSLPGLDSTTRTYEDENASSSDPEGIYGRDRAGGLSIGQ